MSKQLQPVILRDKYWIGVEKLIQRIFFDAVYKDLFKRSWEISEAMFKRFEENKGLY